MKRHRLFQTFDLRHLDFLLVGLIVILNSIGIAAIGSAKHDLQSKQVYGMLLGLAVMLFLSSFDYKRVIQFHWIYYIITVLLLGLVFTPLGVNRDDATRWINIGVTIQPSEFSKILLILFYAKFIMTYKVRMKKVMWITASIVLALPPVLLIYKEPDLSTTIMVCLIIAAILFVCGLSYRIVGAILVVTIPSVILFINFVIQDGSTLLSDYQRGRILAWLHPEDYADTIAYQTMNSIMAIGSGQLMGKGYNTNEISSLLNSGYISESQTDFIFTVIGEEFGFIGSSIVVILLLLITLRIYSIAKSAKDTAGAVIAAGVGTWIGFQGFLNIGVTTGVLPNTGIPLPFVSYGLTSLISLYIGVGFVLNVRMQNMQRTAKGEGIHFGGMT